MRRLVLYLISAVGIRHHEVGYRVICSCDFDTHDFVLSLGLQAMIRRPFSCRLRPVHSPNCRLLTYKVMASSMRGHIIDCQQVAVYICSMTTHKPVGPAGRTSMGHILTDEWG